MTGPERRAAVSDGQHPADLIAEFGCPLVAAAHHPEQRAVLMALNAELEQTVVAGSADARNRIHRALEEVLRTRIRRARRGA